MNPNGVVIYFKTPIYVLGYSAVVGTKEANGPLKGKFDKIVDGNMERNSSFEKEESKMQLSAAKIAIKKASINFEKIEFAVAGDLLNQCIGSNYGLRELNLPFIGVYGACSTLAESIALASIFLESGHVKTGIAVTSSHFCAAERQFRLPLEYGGQRPLTSQWTATAAGAIVIGTNKTNEQIKIKAACIGKIIDCGVKDINNMGAAMAPAAADTLTRFLTSSKTTSTDYDLILTGDLGQVGSDLLNELMEKENLPLNGRHEDCGLLLFDRAKQDVHAGGSGCGCSAAVVCTDILNRLKNKKLKKVLFIATGALMSPTSNQQGESIPGIAHLIFFDAT